MTDLPQLLAIARAAAQHGSDLIQTNRPNEITSKGDRDYTSDVDYAVERALRAMLREATPGIAFLGEEEGPHAYTDGAPCWVLDPIDGTVNFTSGIPLCAISLALVHEDTPVVGVIQLPYLNHTYAGAHGHGATRDGTPISVAQPATLAETVVSIGDYAVGDDARAKNSDRLAITHALANKALRVRMFGSAAIDLVWLAQGSTGATIMLGNRPWDTAAGVLIARESGADVMDMDGTRHTLSSVATVATAPSLTEGVLTLIVNAVAQG